MSDKIKKKFAKEDSGKIYTSKNGGCERIQVIENKKLNISSIHHKKNHRLDFSVDGPEMRGVIFNDHQKLKNSF